MNLLGVLFAATVASVLLLGCSSTAPAASPSTTPRPAERADGPAAGQAQDRAPASYGEPVGVVEAQLLPPPAVPAPSRREHPTTVRVTLETVEKTATLADGVTYRFWTFGGTVPGPMIRVTAGDVVEVTLKNAPDSVAPHSIDLHAVSGPGGGSIYTQTAPGGQTAFRFRALHPGVFVYHCATPEITEHIANGMYGLIVVDPPGGSAPVDREYYVMQGDFYTTGKLGEPGHHAFSLQEALDEQPDYVVFNGAVNSIAGASALTARVGETVRIYFGVGGPNLTSSFHVIGAVFDRVLPEGGEQAVTNVQTTLVPAGGATVVELRPQAPGTYVLVDHSLARHLRGAMGYLEVQGEPRPVYGPAAP